MLSWMLSVLRVNSALAQTKERTSAKTRRECEKRRVITPLVIALESRFMFDGAAAVTADHALADASHPVDHPAAPAPAAHDAPDAAAKALIPITPAPTEVRPADSALDNGKKEVAFVDSSAPGYQTLAAGVRAGVEVEVIDGGQSGLGQIAKWSETHSGYDSIHILSHGTEASLRIGTDLVTSATLDTAVGQAEMAALGSALKAGGDLLIYGCDVAKGEAGQNLVTDIAAATGADIAASTNRTGAAAMGGDWVFESHVGAIESAGALTAEAQAAYDRVLASAHEAPSADALALIPDVTAPTEARAADPTQNNGLREVVFIDTSVADYQTLVDGVRPGVEIELIDGGQDGLAQMALWAERHSGYDAIHVLSYGAEGILRVGTDTVTADTLATPAKQAEMAALGSALNAGGDLMLYGCDVAKGDDGSALVHAIAAATGANVAASTDATGTAAAGGDWVLETSVGAISSPALSPPGFMGLLDAPVINGLGGDSAAWAGVGNTVALDVGANATITDATNDAGTWNGATLTVQRVTGGSADATGNDVFSFNQSGFTVSGSNLQSGGLTFATFTNSGGLLTVSFANGGADATNALVQAVTRAVLYRNDTPYGDAAIRAMSLRPRRATGRRSGPTAGSSSDRAAWL
ncbi:hypothetical protein WCLP8_5010002 [uncultured Gammaproteobacteria bacterium]